MNQKVTLAVSAALMSMSMQAAAELGGAVSVKTEQLPPLTAVQPISINKAKGERPVSPRFVKEAGLENKDYVYIVHLDNDSVAMYEGGVEGFEATNPHSRVLSGVNRQFNTSVRLDANEPAVKAYASYLEQRQSAFLSRASSILGSVSPIASYQYALNALAIKTSPDQAEALSKLAGVKLVERDKLFTLDTDTGPTLVGAPAVWDGSANAGVPGLGEGVIVGILDTGFNTDHPSFADVGGDGYDHTNPLGEGVYLGDCAGDFPELCNDKLIGMFSYPVITDAYDDTTVFPPDLPKNGEDYGGHGSHVGSTAAGNIILNVPEVTRGFEEEFDGEPTGFVFNEISGVAPHANVVSYQVCFGGRSSAGDTYGDCPGAAIAAGLESAIIGPVDVLNYSISGGGNPWNSSTEMAFFAARNAGVFVATSAGNGGPGAATTPKHAPWYTAVAAAEHGRSVDYNKEIGEFTGGDSTLEDITGVSNTDGISASIVYAGDYENPNSPDEPEQCLEPFPEGTFDGQIVVCDRGSIARVAKAQNVAAGGAGGYVLANLQGAATSLNSDAYIIPGIHIDADSGDALKAWLASGADHAGTITAGEGTLTINPDRVDVLAGFSSKGPNTSISTLTPTMTGPGVNIYAAYADQHFGHDGNGPSPADYAYLSGTSMSSPHIAGAGALVKSVRPSWTPDNIRAALAMTAETTVLKEDGVTPGDWFDMGSGRIRVDLAINSGLVMDETTSNYVDANPAEGGEPRSLNLPSVTDDNCVGTCTWTRTVTATQAGDWSVSAASISPGLDITVTPATFTLAEGESQELTVEIDAFDAASDVWSFGIINLTSADSPDLHMPVSVVASTGNIPTSLAFEAMRNEDSYLLSDVVAVEITDLQTSVAAVAASQTVGELPMDSDNSSILDDLTDGLSITEVTVPEGALRMVAEITETTSPDLDLFVVLDANADGIPTEDEIVAVSASATAFERVNVMEPAAGFYWIIVQNWAASGEGVSDPFTLSYGTVLDEATDLIGVDAPSAVGQLTPFDIRFNWNLADASEGDRFYSAVTMGTDAESPDNLGLIPLDLTRVEDDVNIVTEQLERVNAGDTIDYAVAVAANFTPEDRDYSVSVTVPEGFSAVGASLGENATYDAESSTITWTLSQTSLLGASPSYNITTNATDPACLNPEFGQGGGYLDLEAFGIGFASLDGDTVNGTFGVNANVLGTLYESITVTDDGFATVGTEVSATPWVNQLMPDSDDPNGVLAPFWRDLIFDVENGSGLSVATAGAAVTILEWDNMRFPSEFYGIDPTGDLIDFQIVIMNQVGPESPNVIYSYANVTHDLGNGLPVSVGYEDLSGTVGQTALYSGSEGLIGDPAATIADGLQVCMYLLPVEDTPTLLPFSVTVDSGNVGGPAQMVAVSEVTNSEFTASVASEVESSVQVEGAPIVLIDGSAAATMTVIELRELDIPGSVFEPNGDAVEILWRQVDGPAAVIAGNGLESPTLMAPEVEEDTVVTLVVEATDVNGNVGTATIDVTVTNNLAPTLTVTAPTSVSEGTTITVTASGSDPEGDELAYTINGIAGSTLSVTAPGTNSETTVSFTVTASDGLNTTTQTVSVRVTDNSGGSMGWIALLLVPVVYLRRRMK